MRAKSVKTPTAHNRSISGPGLGNCELLGRPTPPPSLHGPTLQLGKMMEHLERAQKNTV